MRHTAYLIVICDKQTNEILGATIWSSPEWEQSRYLSDVRTYVAWQLTGNTFSEAAKAMLGLLADPVMCRRYHWLYQHIDEQTFAGHGVARVSKAEAV